MTVDSTLAAIRPADERAMAAARDLQARLTKPAGSLGALEDLSVRLSGLAGVCPPRCRNRPRWRSSPATTGSTRRASRPWPQEVTAQMMANFVGGGAVVNAFARQAGADVLVVDVGVAHPLYGGATLLDANIRRGTRDMTEVPALTRAEAQAALEVGIGVAGALADAGAKALLTGDMGIANTTPAAALIAVFTGAAPAAVTGRGTGIDDETYAPEGRGRHRRPWSVTSRTRPDPLGVLAAVGGLEHAALTGFVLGAAARRLPVILDGVIAASAALAAAAFAPDAVAAMVAGHRSAEPGAAVALAHLGLTPLIDLGMRLGEGSGAVLALPIVACASGCCTRWPPSTRPEYRRSDALPARTATRRPPGPGRRGRRGGHPPGAGPAGRRRPRRPGLARLSPGLHAHADAGRLTWIERRFEPADVEGAWLVQVAVDDPVAAAEVSAAAEQHRIFCVRADDRDAATAWTPAVTRHGPITVAVTDSGDRRAAGPYGTWWPRRSRPHPRPGRSTPAWPWSGPAPGTPS